MSTPTHCLRCGADLSKTGSIMSKFNQDTICLDCKERERNHPAYPAADAAEIAAVERGEMNFPGVGCPRELYWFSLVQPGDALRPAPAWNRTERPNQHLASPTKVLRVTPANSQSGVLFTVKTLGGHERTLDAGWFLPPKSPQEKGA